MLELSSSFTKSFLNSQQNSSFHPKPTNFSQLNVPVIYDEEESSEDHEQQNFKRNFNPKTIFRSNLLLTGCTSRTESTYKKLLSRQIKKNKQTEERIHKCEKQNILLRQMIKKIKQENKLLRKSANKMKDNRRSDREYFSKIKTKGRKDKKKIFFSSGMKTDNSSSCKRIINSTTIS